MRILIIEDSASDVRAYLPIISTASPDPHFESELSGASQGGADREVDLLFLRRNGPENSEELRELVAVHCGEVGIKKYLLAEEAEIPGLLKERPYDFYIADSLGGVSPALLRAGGIPKEKTAFLSSTTSFREMIMNEGYRAYRKDAIEDLIAECLHS